MPNMTLLTAAVVLVLALGACASTPADSPQMTREERADKHQRLLAENEYARQERLCDINRQQGREREQERRQMRTCTVDSSGKQVCN